MESTWKIQENGVVRDMTTEEIAESKAREIPIDINKMRLEAIRKIRNLKLKETDYFATSDNTMSDEMKTYRQSMRDIPQDYSETDYDDLLARDEQGNLTHTVWSKP